MVYRKRPPKSRRYNQNHSHDQQSVDHNPNDQNIVIAEEKASTPQAEAAPPSSESQRTTKTPNSLGFLSSIFGTRDRTERSGSPLFTVFNYDIYFDDLLLAGLIILLLTDKVEDELLLIILLYLLLDIF